jgi:long-subunit fatty acid transport protein
MRPQNLRCLRAVLPLSLPAIGLAVLLPARVARATGILEFPDNGSEQMARGGAWMVRASDPLAAFYNPAGLAGQQTRVTVQSNFSLQKTCFTRQQAANDPTDEPLSSATGAFPKVCSNDGVSPDPQIGITFRVNDRIGIGFLPLIAPSAAASNNSWPMFVNGEPSPQRYMLVDAKLLLITPTLGAGFEVTDRLRLGASFQWGIATFDYKSATAAVNGSLSGGGGIPQPKSNDALAEASGHDYFVPGFTAGAIWSPNDNVDLGGWYKYSAPVSTSADLKATPAAWASKPTPIMPATMGGPTCGSAATEVSPYECDLGNVGKVKQVLPMEAKVGVRYHMPRPGLPYDEHTRDPMSQDVFDLEANFTWANDSAASNLQIRFPQNPDGSGMVAVPGTPGSAPPIADVQHGYRDVFGIRLGGDFNVLPDRLAIRAGGFLETAGQNPQYQNIDADGAQKEGLAIGGTYRIRFGPPEKLHAIEISVGYEHVFYVTETNNGPNGLPALTGTNCDPAVMANPAMATCPGGTQKFRTPWPINLGTITNEVNVFNAGVSYRF